MNINLAKQNRQASSELAAGTYLVGDPCYAFSNDVAGIWMEWLRDAWKDTDPNSLTILEGRVRGMRIAASSTAHGDGVYTGSDGFEYSVDAGLLGAVHIGFLLNLHPTLFSLPSEEIQEKTGMRVVDFAEPFTVRFDASDGTVYIGDIAIPTGEDFEEEYEDEGTDNGIWGDDEDEENEA